MLDTIKNSKWFDPVVITGFLTLFVTNGISFYQYKEANERAKHDEQRAEELQRKKEDWMDDLNDKIDELDQKMGNVRISLETDEIAATTMVGQESLVARSNIHADSAQLDALAQEKSELEKQRNDLEVNSR